MKILVTGAAGFIGFHLSRVLLADGHQVVGLDNINDYYDVNLKFARLKELGVDFNDHSPWHVLTQSERFEGFSFVKMGLEEKSELEKLFKSEGFEVVCNLAAQAGVRYSLENPDAYVQSNLVGFVNILECVRHFQVKHLVYASSSSVYGTNIKIPFSTEDTVDHPISLYAASKKSNELMAHTYSHLFGFASTGLRFFTVYGPWGRPDMALFLFAEAIKNGEKLKVFNYGEMERDFTYVADIVEGVKRIIEKPVVDRDLYKVYNIGNSKCVKLMDFIEEIETQMGKTAEKELLPLQEGDVPKTWADVKDLERDYDYHPSTPVQEGIKHFVDWYKQR
ncbi:MAG: NAD-dependent epimerase [Flavobacteriaceae bacterium]